MKYFTALLLFAMLATVSCFGEELSIDEILGQLQTEQDLSKKTKQENVGHIMVFSRDDIERMRLKTLKDFIDYIPFVHYKINHYGFVDPYYETATLTREALFRVFIDDKEFYLPFRNNGLKMLANINLHFIDHAEVYFGVPSFTFGTEVSLTTIKLYTKDPKREDTNLIGFEASNKKSFGTNLFSAKAFDDFSYLLNISYADTKLPKTSYEKYQLSRDKDNANIFAKFDFQEHGFYLFTSKSEFDDFLGESLGFNVKDMRSENILLSGGYSYKNDDDLKINLDYTHSKTKLHQSTDAVLDIVSLKEPPYVFLPKTSHFHLQERVLDIGISKKYFFDETSFLVGAKGRYKHAKIDNFFYNHKPFHQRDLLREDLVTSLYAEISHSINSSNLLVASVKFDHIKRKKLANDNLFFAKLGYIYSGENLYFKHYFYAGDLANQYYDFAFKALEKASHDKKEDFYGTSSEIGYKTEKSQVAFLARYVTFEKENIFLPLYNYLPYSDKVERYCFSLLYGYNFSPLSKIDFNLATSKTTWDNSEEFDSKWLHSGYIRYLTSYNKFDFANIFVFGEDFQSFNFVLNYKHNRNLNFYFKANNIFDSGYKQKFNGFKIQNARIEGADTLNDVKISSREFFLGVEYLF